MGAAMGIATFVACETVTAGVGTVGCMMAAGAAGKMTTDYLDGNIHGVGDIVNSAATGAVEGLLAVPLAAADLVTQAGNIAGDVKEGDWAGAAGHGALAALDVLTVVDGVKGPGKCSHSFTAATPVLLADGTGKPISDIELGDEVLSTDPQTGQNAAEQVEVLHDNLDHDLVDLTVKLPDGSLPVINTTAHHPFWDETDRKWTDAAELQTNHHLRDADGHDTVTVADVHVFPGARHMLDLTVANIHTYYVLAGDTPVLVHNCGSGVDANGNSCKCANGPNSYSVAFEMTLEKRDFGRSRGTHFRRANAALDKALKSDSAFAAAMEKLIPGVGASVASKGGRRTPSNWTWQHEPSVNAGGRQGVMRLVPESQHRPGSVWQGLLHPGGAGGYAEWAIPNGAPPN
jgi:hypothetical protein